MNESSVLKHPHHRPRPRPSRSSRGISYAAGVLAPSTNIPLRFWECLTHQLPPLIGCFLFIVATASFGPFRFRALMFPPRFGRKLVERSQPTKCQTKSNMRGDGKRSKRICYPDVAANNRIMLRLSCIVPLCGTVYTIIL